MIVTGDFDKTLALRVDGKYDSYTLTDLLFEAWSAGIAKEDLKCIQRGGCKTTTIMDVPYGEYTSDSVFK